MSLSDSTIARSSEFLVFYSEPWNWLDLKSGDYLHQTLLKAGTAGSTNWNMNLDQTRKIAVWGKTKSHQSLKLIDHHHRRRHLSWSDPEIIRVKNGRAALSKTEVGACIWWDACSKINFNCSIVQAKLIICVWWAKSSVFVAFIKIYMTKTNLYIVNYKGMTRHWSISYSGRTVPDYLIVT